MEQARRPVLFFSGGKASSLLWHMCQSYNMVYVVLYDEVQLERLKFLEELYLQAPYNVVSFRPMSRILLPADEGLRLLSYYDLRGEGWMAALTTPVQDGDYCIFDWLAQPVRKAPDFTFDCIITGKRAEFQQEQLGEIEVVNPLWDWTDGEVWEAIKREAVPYDKARYDEGGKGNLDYLKVCTRCFTESGVISCPRGGYVNTAEMKLRALKDISW